MAKSTTKSRFRVDLSNLSAYDKDVLQLPVPETRQKYNIEKMHTVYDRRTRLRRTIKSLGMNEKDFLSTLGSESPSKPIPKKAAKKSRVQPTPGFVTEPFVQKNDALLPEVPKNNTPVIHRPIEMKFDNFTIKLNGVPTRIAINPETHAIEIDL